LPANRKLSLTSNGPRRGVKNSQASRISDHGTCVDKRTKWHNFARSTIIIEYTWLRSSKPEGERERILQREVVFIFVAGILGYPKDDCREHERHTLRDVGVSVICVLRGVSEQYILQNQDRLLSKERVRISIAQYR
jgi:hypothetical protein